MWPRCITAWERPSERGGRRSPILTWRSRDTASWMPCSARRTRERECRYRRDRGSAPELLCRQARALRQRLELRPHDTRVDVRVAPCLRRETAVGASDHVLPPDGPREADDALPNQLRVLHQIRRVGDDPGDNCLTL